jgi:hypothetical protein
MKKYQLSLLFFQLVASAILMVADANAGSFDLKRTANKPAEETDLEIETNNETDIFPGVLTFSMFINQ